MSPHPVPCATTLFPLVLYEPAITDLLVASRRCHILSLFGVLDGLFSWPGVIVLSSFCCVSSSVTALSLSLCSGHPLLPPLPLCLLVFIFCCNHWCACLSPHLDCKLLEGPAPTQHLFEECTNAAIHQL